MRVQEPMVQPPEDDIAALEAGIRPRVKRGRLILILLVALLAIGAVVAAGILPRLKARQRVIAETNEIAVPTVDVIHPRFGAPVQEIALPADIQPYISAPIFARTSGYLKKWYFDIGASVPEGGLLAEIDTPEVDAQLRSARADLATAQANRQLSQTTADRYLDLLKSDSVSKQETDNATGDLAAKKATELSVEANVKRLEDLQAFEKVYAPFAGVVTARNTDIGQLINAGSGTPATELFRMAAVRTLRVFVEVPQFYSGAARKGMEVDLTLPQFSGRRFKGTLVRTADSIEASSRTLRTEIDVNNASGELMPGAYAEAHLKLPEPARTLMLPVPALIFRADGLQVATVGANGRAALKSVVLGRDFGTEVEVANGLNPSDTVIINPPDSLIDGEQVRPVESDPNPPPAGSAPAAKSKPSLGGGK